MTCRPATREDMIEYYGELPDLSMRASVLVYADKLVGAGGVVYSKIPMAFMDLKEGATELKGYKKAVIKACGLMMDYIRENHVLIYVMRENHELSCGFLSHYGFKQFGHFNEYDMYSWVKK